MPVLLTGQWHAQVAVSTAYVMHYSRAMPSHLGKAVMAANTCLWTVPAAEKLFCTPGSRQRHCPQGVLAGLAAIAAVAGLLLKKRVRAWSWRLVIQSNMA